MYDSEKVKVIHDLKYLISVNSGEQRKFYENQLQELQETKKSRK